MRIFYFCAVFGLRDIGEIIRDFSRISGPWVVLGVATARVLSFFASWLAYRLVSTEALGKAIYALQIIAFILPFMGMGLYHSAAKYGSALNDRAQRLALLHGLWRVGRRWALLMSSVLSAWSGLFSTDWGLPGSSSYVALLSWMLWTTFEYEMWRTGFRLTEQNHLYARAEILHWLWLCIGVIVFAPLWGAMGYALSFVLAPAVTVVTLRVLWGDRMAQLSIRSPSGDIATKQHYRYGIYTSLANLLGRLLLAVDLLWIGLLLGDPRLVTFYKYIGLIPFSILFLPAAYMTAYFVRLTERAEQWDYIYHFIRRYQQLFSGMAILFLIVAIPLGPHLLRLFGVELLPYYGAYVVLCVGVTGILVIRGLYGNLLSAIGRSDLAAYAVLIGLIINGIANGLLIPRLGLLGAALTSCGVMWLTGLLSMWFFHRHYRRGS